MYIDIIAPVVTLVCAERENQQFGFQGGNLGDTVRMSKSKAAGKENCTETVSFAQFISLKGLIVFCFFPGGGQAGIRSCAANSEREKGAPNIPISVRMRMKPGRCLLFLISTPPVVLFLTVYQCLI